MLIYVRLIFINPPPNPPPKKNTLLLEFRFNYTRLENIGCAPPIFGSSFQPIRVLRFPRHLPWYYKNGYSEIDTQSLLIYLLKASEQSQIGCFLRKGLFSYACATCSELPFNTLWHIPMRGFPYRYSLSDREHPRQGLVTLIYPIFLII